MGKFKLQDRDSRTELFKVPVDYFEKLPSRIQLKTIDNQNKRIFYGYKVPSVRLVFSLAVLLVLTMGTYLWMVNRGSNPSLSDNMDAIGKTGTGYQKELGAFRQDTFYSDFKVKHKDMRSGSFETALAEVSVYEIMNYIDNDDLTEYTSDELN